jgi:hypothetical protein
MGGRQRTDGKEHRFLATKGTRALRISDCRLRILITKNGKKKGTKKDKKSRKHGFLREILKNGVVSGSKKGDFIGLIRF